MTGFVVLSDQKIKANFEHQSVYKSSPLWSPSTYHFYVDTGFMRELVYYGTPMSYHKVRLKNNHTLNNHVDEGR